MPLKQERSDFTILPSSLLVFNMRMGGGGGGGWGGGRWNCFFSFLSFFNGIMRGGGVALLFILQWSNELYYLLTFFCSTLLAAISINQNPSINPPSSTQPNPLFTLFYNKYVVCQKVKTWVCVSCWIQPWNSIPAFSNQNKGVWFLS